MLGSLTQHLQEFFFLRQAERKTSQLTASQRHSLRAHCEAASRRLSLAAQLGAPSEMSVALSLYHSAAFFLICALLVAKDEAIDADALTPESAFDRLDRMLLGERLEPPFGLTAARQLLARSAPLAYDRLSAEEAGRRLYEFAATTRWLSTLTEARSPAELKLARTVRLTTAALCGVAMLTWLVSWIVSPKNVALGKPVTSSSASEGTAPVGAVDGVKNGRFGFHSAEENSPWLAIDLGAPYRIASVKVFGRGDAYFEQSIPLAFEVSDDGRSFRKIAERSRAFSESDPWVIEPNALVTRLVRLRTERRSYLVVSEVEVYGTLKK